MGASGQRDARRDPERVRRNRNYLFVNKSGDSVDNFTDR